MALPSAVQAMAGRGANWSSWVDGLPRLIEEILADWDLTQTGALSPGDASVFVPVRSDRDEAAMLKIGVPSHDSEHEHLALQHWQGRGAPRLLRAAPRRRVLLLETWRPVDLTDLWDMEACEIVAELYGDLHRPAPPQLPTLSSYVEGWVADLEQLPRSAAIPRRLVEQAISVGRRFLGDPRSDGTMIHGDLHYANVLAADRTPWVAINPQPISGDPHYEVAPMLWHRFEELHGDVRGGVRGRFHALVDGAGLDEDRARQWVVLRMINSAARELRGATGSVPDQDRLTRCVAVAKAVQD